ncbi:MAG: polysaccharide deacetylase family protein [Bacteroidetes bacterium]|nr:polysaccharide deacetylase family protein [Bacteroidota bacterium]
MCKYPQSVCIFIAVILFVMPAIIKKRKLLLLASVCFLAGFGSCNQASSTNQQTKDSVNKPALKLLGSSENESVAFKQNIDTTKSTIYLTFDDGPQKGTIGCYNTCKTLGIKASFFMVGLHQNIKSDGKQLVSMIRNGYPEFLLTNHSYTHAKDKYKDFYHHPQAALIDFLSAQDSLKVAKKIVRLPGNRAWVRANDITSSHLVSGVAHLLDSSGYNVIGWDLEWNFSHKTGRPIQTAEKLAAQVDSAFAHQNMHIRKHLVILTHDRIFQRPADSLSLAKFIGLLKTNPNYVFETVDHLPGLKN